MDKDDFMKHNLKQILLVIFLSFCVLSTQIIFAADGDLDTTFGNGGIVTTNMNTGPDIGYAVALQTDGKLLLLDQQRMEQMLIF